MPSRRRPTVAILGGGPAGSTVAAYLARGGATVVLYDRGKRPPIVVGESLVPAIVPYLRELGVEDDVKAYSVVKPGATFAFRGDCIRSFNFAEVPGAMTTYAYNVPRDRFDRTLQDAARRAGVHVVAANARVERAAGGAVQLDGETLAASGPVLDRQPDWIIDATGRARTLAQLLGIPAHEGNRRDAALHAHVEGLPLIDEGHVHTVQLERGWAWLIPLPGKVSVGLVVPRERLEQLGTTAEAQFDALLAQDMRIRERAAAVRRVSPVLRYTNYQLRSTRGAGRNWALVGDAFGFVDPVFSSGLLLGMDAARVLAGALLDGRPAVLARWEARVQRHLAAWQRVATYFYDGRLFAMIRTGDHFRERFPYRLLDFHFRKHLPRVLTGEASTRYYSFGLLSFMAKHAIRGEDPADYAIS